MQIRELFHGSESHKLLYNLRNNSLTADAQGRIFFAEREWQNCLVHGTDSKTGEAYVAKFRVEIPDGANLEQQPTSGNRDARILRIAPGGTVKAEILELWVRTGTVGSFETKQIPKAQIQTYLEAKAAFRNSLKEVAEKLDKLQSEYDLNSGDHQAQLDLYNNNFAGFWTNRLFNAEPPQTVIWDNTYAGLLRIRRHLRNRDLGKATAELMITRLWYLYAYKKYTTWKDGIESAGSKMQIAIVVTAVALVAAAVTAYFATAAATGAAATGTAATEQTLVRIAASVANAERAMALADAAIAEAEILEAIAIAERAAVMLL